MILPTHQVIFSPTMVRCCSIFSATSFWNRSWPCDLLLVRMKILPFVSLTIVMHAYGVVGELRIVTDLSSFVIHKRKALLCNVLKKLYCATGSCSFISSRVWKSIFSLKVYHRLFPWYIFFSTMHDVEKSFCRRSFCVNRRSFSCSWRSRNCSSTSNAW